MKKRKFAEGGALGGLDTVNQGYEQINDSLSTIQEGLDGGSSNSPVFAGASDATQNLKGLGLKKGGKVVSASKRGDGIAQRGKTRGKMY